MALMTLTRTEKLTREQAGGYEESAWVPPIERHDVRG